MSGEDAMLPYRIEEALQRALHAFAIKWIFGPRCPDFDPGCLACRSWALHDRAFG